MQTYAQMIQRNYNELPLENFFQNEFSFENSFETLDKLPVYQNEYMPI